MDTTSRSCCGYCFGVGLSYCCYSAGCWQRPIDRLEEDMEREEAVLAKVLAIQSRTRKDDEK